MVLMLIDNSSAEQPHAWFQLPRIVFTLREPHQLDSEA
jgi:hypothetical protein